MGEIKCLVSLYFCVCLSCIPRFVLGQQSALPLDKRVIEVTGMADTSFAPNEFTFKLVVRERFENKEKITVEQQEEKLKLEPGKAGFDVGKDFSVMEGGRSFMLQKGSRYNNIPSREFHLHVRDSSVLAAL